MNAQPDPTAGLDFEKLRPVIDAQPYPLLFVTISGAHLYGFASPDSDFDLRGVHLLPPEEVLGLEEPRRTVELSEWSEDGLEIDLVTHDAEKFMRMLLKRNGYVLEQLYSPLIIRGGETHEAMKRIARGCITRHHVHHYHGFARNQWRLFEKEDPPRIKPLLYVYRVLLTGIHLMRTGEVEASLPRLNERFELPFIDELIRRKAEHGEHSTLGGADLEQHRREFDRLTERLEQAGEQSDLPDIPSVRQELNDLLVRLRLEAVKNG